MKEQSAPIQPQTVTWPDALQGTGSLCQNCGKRPASQWWVGENGIAGAIHGWSQRWCDLCVTKAQLVYARKIAKNIPDLERKLAKLRRATAV